MSCGSQYPFLVHASIEFAAGINFLFHPSEQLSSLAPQAEAVIRQYGVLLLVSVIIALIFATRDVDSTSRKASFGMRYGEIIQAVEHFLTPRSGNVSGALSIYHLAPITRAYSQINGGVFDFGKALGGPAVHLVVHVICFLSLFQLCVRGRYKQRVDQKKGE